MSSCSWAAGNHAIAACARGQAWALDGRRLRERAAASFRGSRRSNPSRSGARRGRIHRRKRGWGRPQASKAPASKAKIGAPRFLTRGGGRLRPSEATVDSSRINERQLPRALHGATEPFRSPAGVAFHQVSVEGFGDDPKLDDEVGLDGRLTWPASSSSTRTAAAPGRGYGSRNSQR